MSIYIIAQLIGFVGYLFYIAAPCFKTKTSIIQMDIIACVILCAQWYLLGQPSLLVLNALGLVISISALMAKNDERISKYLFLLYPIGCLSIILVSEGSFIDILALVAFCFIVASKTSLEISAFRTYAIVGGTILIASGAIALSIPAVIFNTVFIGAHIFKLWQNTATPQTAHA